MFFGGASIFDEWGVVRWGQKVLFKASIISSSQDFSPSNKHDTFWHVVSTGYFFVLFSWVISVSDFCPLEIYKNLGLLLSTITFTVNSHADNNFFKYISQVFFIKIQAKVCYIQIWFKCETPFFSNENHGLHKKLQKKIVFFCKNYWITCCTHMMSHAIWVDEIKTVWRTLQQSPTLKRHYNSYCSQSQIRRSADTLIPSITNTVSILLFCRNQSMNANVPANILYWCKCT